MKLRHGLHRPETCCIKCHFQAIYDPAILRMQSTTGFQLKPPSPASDAKGTSDAKWSGHPMPVGIGRPTGTALGQVGRRRRIMANARLDPHGWWQGVPKNGN